jgi:hypothetical protein
MQGGAVEHNFERDKHQTNKQTKILQVLNIYHNKRLS